MDCFEFCIIDVSGSSMTKNAGYVKSFKTVIAPQCYKHIINVIRVVIVLFTIPAKINDLKRINRWGVRC